MNGNNIGSVVSSAQDKSASLLDELMRLPRHYVVAKDAKKPVTSIFSDGGRTGFDDGDELDGYHHFLTRNAQKERSHNKECSEGIAQRYVSQTKHSMELRLHQRDRSQHLPSARYLPQEQYSPA